MNQIGTNIKRLRKSSGLTQEELGERLNITRQAVSLWERGQTHPDIETLKMISAVFE
ncbi:MAG: helix-turn-helix transcriptional regulator, partial [Firmicutes bacterium]|nr:helix-turn-helix transcriptional regulator [Bacillota bacterium]